MYTVTAISAELYSMHSVPTLRNSFDSALIKCDKLLLLHPPPRPVAAANQYYLRHLQPSLILPTSYVSILFIVFCPINHVSSALGGLLEYFSCTLEKLASFISHALDSHAHTWICKATCEDVNAIIG
ncbi:unnamed protein product [Hymenolepis diminuta]|uniref:Uncharacterized protein n=1 Tax=Hymenolepis diminuta TaxID=6216 RepID=A0A564YX99_HYMDI|nr:unnamed protein product [Hymenolepis diminuta]